MTAVQRKKGESWEKLRRRSRRNFSPFFRCATSFRPKGEISQWYVNLSLVTEGAFYGGLRVKYAMTCRVTHPTGLRQARNIRLLAYYGYPVKKYDFNKKKEQKRRLQNRPKRLKIKEKDR